MNFFFATSASFAFNTFDGCERAFNRKVRKDRKGRTEVEIEK
jgi:hypothetical protein